MSVGIVVPRERDASLPSEAPGLQSTRRSATWSPRPTGSTGASSRPRPIRATSPTCSTSTGTLTTGSCSSRRCADESSDPLPSIRQLRLGPRLANRLGRGRALAVHPAARGAGVAKALLTTCEHIARKDGAPVFAFHSGSFMTGAIALYEKFGYRRAPEFDVDLNAHYGIARALPATALAYLRYLSTAAARPGHSRCTHHEDHAPQRARPVGCGRSGNTDGEIESHQPFPIGEIRDQSRAPPRRQHDTLPLITAKSPQTAAPFGPAFFSNSTGLRW
jgi:hypothetical protein